MVASTSRPAFLKKLDFIIGQHLSDNKLDVGMLARLVCMSRSDLHRKLVRTEGMSIMRYVRHIRLQKASELLLEHPDWSIYQVALEVGFSSQGYFSRRFREAFGVCPMDWRQAEGNLEHL